MCFKKPWTSKRKAGYRWKILIEDDDIFSVYKKMTFSFYFLSMCEIYSNCFKIFF